MSPRACLLFDLDYTLTASQGAGSAAMRRAFGSEPGTSAALDDLGGAFQGRTDGFIIGEIARRSGVDAASLWARYEDDYPRLLGQELDDRDVRVLPGVTVLLDALAARDDVAFCLATGNSRRAAFLKLERAGLERYFGGGGFGDRHEHRAHMLREAIDAVGWQPGERLVVIGDSEHDVAAAHDVDAIAAGVATGSLSEAQLIDAGADVTLPDLGDLQRTLDALLGAG